MTRRESRVCKACASRGVFRWAVTDGACSVHATHDAPPLSVPHVVIVGQPANDPATRLTYLRGEIRAERISYGELHELQTLAEHIAPDDVELLEWAGVPEFGDDQ